MLDVRFQPMTDRPRRRPNHQYYERSPFKGKTPLDDLERELAYLKATDVVIESGHDRLQIRNDGWPRGGTRPVHNDVRLYFQCKHGALRYECNNCDSWEANLRAISLWLQRQRLAIEEWGIGTGGEAYRGFAALPPGASSNGTLAEWTNAEASALFLRDTAEQLYSAREILDQPEILRKVWTTAAKKVHPDVQRDNGEMMSKVNRAKDYIESARTK